MRRNRSERIAGRNTVCMLGLQLLNLHAHRSVGVLNLLLDSHHPLQHKHPGFRTPPSLGQTSSQESKGEEKKLYSRFVSLSCSEQTQPVQADGCVC